MKAIGKSGNIVGTGATTAAGILDAGATGIAVVQAATPVAARQELGIGYDPTEFSVTHIGGATATQAANSPTTTLTGGRHVIEMSANANCAVAVTNTNECVAPQGGGEAYRNLDALCSITFSHTFSVSISTLVWRCGFGKASTDAIGDWANNGYGFVQRGTALYGWYYVSGALHEVDLATVMTINSSRRLTVERTGVGFIWFVNGYKVGSAECGSLGNSRIWTYWRNEVTNGATATATKIVVSVIVERVVSPIDSGVGYREGSVLSGLTQLEVGGYRQKTVEPAKYRSIRPDSWTQCRVYLIPRGDTSSVASGDVIAGIKLFGKDFDADTANYDDFGIYNAPKGLVFNSKRLGTGAVKSFLFCDQDNTDFVKVDVVTREVELLLAGKGLVMKSPDGTRYRLTIANGGTVSVAAVT